MKVIANCTYRLLIVPSLICSIHLAAEEPFYDQLKSLTATNDTGPSPTDSRLKEDPLLDSGLVAGVRIGMNMSEVVEKWGKPKLLYSNCMRGPRLDYPAAALFFSGDTLIRVGLQKSLKFRSVTNTPGPLPKNRAPSEYYLRFTSLFDSNNTRPYVTNLFARGTQIHPESVAGVTLGMKMPEVIQLWGKPIVFWTPSTKSAVLGYNNFSLLFDGETLKDISGFLPSTPQNH